MNYPAIPRPEKYWQRMDKEPETPGWLWAFLLGCIILVIWAIRIQNSVGVALW